ncbi:MAG TPA: hypothetical protein VHU88_18435 [Sporichthyaceae bacterium]|jgi:hypothetical protein|nr:hypothetical protein [Sporichthyaceae bacterium]
MAEPAKHRRPDSGLQRKEYRRGLVARGGLAGALLVGFGFAVQETAANSGQSAAGAADLIGRDDLGKSASRDLLRPALNLPATIAAPKPTLVSLAKINLAALRRAERYVGARHDWAHMCLAFVRTAFKLPSNEGSAIGAWRAARHKHRGDRRPPAGVPVFWSGGSSGAGHVAVSLGNGWIVSTDQPYTGHISKVRLSTIANDWGLNYLGWTEDLEGVRVYTPAISLG